MGYQSNQKWPTRCRAVVRHEVLPFFAPCSLHDRARRLMDEAGIELQHGHTGVTTRVVRRCPELGRVVI